MKQKGFTLIELMVVISITAILGALGTAGFVNYNKNQVLQASTNEVVTMLNLAKSRAQSQIVPSGSCTSTNLASYAVAITASSNYNDNSNKPNEYTLEIICSDENIVPVPGEQDKKLPTGLKFDNTVTFTFPVQTGYTQTSGSITISNSDGNKRVIMVNSLGGVSVLSDSNIALITSTPPPATSTPAPTSPPATSTPMPSSTPPPATSTPAPTSSPTPTPSPTPKLPQTPVQTNFRNSVYFSASGYANSAGGFRFKANVNGKITALWDYSAGDQTSIILWSDTGAMLTGVNVTGNNNAWVQGTLSTPYSITAGTYYRVANNVLSSGYHYAFNDDNNSSPPTPRQYGDIVIDSFYISPYVSNFPNTPVGFLFGMPDITFVPN